MSSAQTEAEQVGTEDAWSYYELSNSAVDTLRDELGSAIPDEWERIDDAHVSILPGFDVASDEMDTAFEHIGNMGERFVGEDIQINGVECFHELDDSEPTFVVKLDVDIDLERIRSEQEKWVEIAGGSLNFPPVEPHVKLFKAGDGDDDHEPLTAEQRAELEAAIESVDAPETLSVEHLNVETY